MINKEIQTYFEMASLQIAAEAFLIDTNSTLDLKALLETGNMANSKLPSAQIASFYVGVPGSDSRFELVAYQDLSLRTPEPTGMETGLESGFSASLFYDNEKEEYTISFRSTEFAENIRDAGDIETNVEIAEFGWAFSQLHSMDAFWKYLTAGTPLVTGGLNVPVSSALEQFRTDIANGGLVNVTGYSLGANLATAFTEINAASVARTYLFNGAGTGETVSSIGLGPVWALYDFVFNDPAAELPNPLLDPAPNVLGVLAADSRAPGQLSFDSSIALNPRHWIALEAIRGSVIGSLFAGPVFNQQTTPFRKESDFSSLITDIWADDTTDPSALENGVAASGIRHGRATPIWYEEQSVISLFGDSWFDFGDGHSIALLHDSLAVMSMFEKLDPTVKTDLLGEIFDVAAHQEHKSLEFAVNGLARVFGVAPIAEMDIASGPGDFANIDQRNALHNVISAIENTALFKLFIDEDEDTGVVTAKASIRSAESGSALQDANNDFGQFLALQQLTPFVIQDMDADVEQALKDAHSEVAAAWDSDQNLTPEQRADGMANYSDQYYADRTLFLTTLLGRNRENQWHGNLQAFETFTDETQSISFRADALPLLEGRAQLVFGSDEGEVNTLPTSIHDDRLYGMGGSDTIAGLSGDDYLEGGAGNDILNGDAGEDYLLGGAEDDVLSGGSGDDTLVGGSGMDIFAWETDGGTDTILDSDSGGDRITVNGIDLADLTYTESAPNTGVYTSSTNTGLELVYNGAQLLVSVEENGQTGRIYVNHFEPIENANFGIVLGGYVEDLPATNYGVVDLGNGAGETPYDPADRPVHVPEQDWESTSIYFNAADVANYSGEIDGVPFSILPQEFFGGPIGDHIIGDLGANQLWGLAGGDLIEGGGGSDRLLGGQGSDHIAGGEGEDFIWGGAEVGGNYSTDAQAQVYDMAGDLNVLDGGGGADKVSGGRYRDHIDGGADNDVLWGGTGNDVINGGANDDVIYGDSNMEWRWVDPDNDGQNLLVQLQNALAEGADSQYDYADVISGGDGSDTVWGEQGDDIVFGGDGDDQLHGDRTAHSFYISPWDSTTTDLEDQYHGNDYLFGGAGTDFLWGDAGDDFLSGGTETDVLDGGAGDDTFHYALGDGVNFVTDTSGAHTFLFSDISASDLRITHVPGQLGQRWVVVGTSSQAGIQITESEWDNVQIALGTPDALVERSSIETRYFSLNSGEVAWLDGVYGITDAQRDALFQVNDEASPVPQLNLSADIENGEVRPITSLDGPKVQLSFSTSAYGPLFEFNIVISEFLLDDVTLDGNAGLSYVGFAGDIDGTDGNDSVIGSDMADTIFTGTGDDLIVGGGGADFLDGGLGFDTYVFASGDGADTVTDVFGDTFFEFEGIDSTQLSLNLTTNSGNDFRIEYSDTDSLTTANDLSVDRVKGILVDGQLAPITIRSDLLDAVLRGTDGNNIFETGEGDDIILADGEGEDVYTFSSGDGSDNIAFDVSPFAINRVAMGEIRFEDTSGVEPMTFGFGGSGFTIDYGAGDEVTVSQNYITGSFDNAMLHLTFSSESELNWIPEIHTQIGGNTYGSLGADHFVGSNIAGYIVPSYGDDLIEGGTEDDTIYLDRFYLNNSGGIGHKDIRAGQGNDTIYTPLAQGATYRFGVGDGHDKIVYNWSTTLEYDFGAVVPAPYEFSLVSPSELSLNAYGDDRIVFDQNIALGDLDYVRFDDTLQISVNDGADRIRIENFFVTDPVSESPNFGAVDFGGIVVSSLEALVARGELHENPLREIVVGGQTYDLPTILATNLVVLDGPPPVTLLGTEGDDYIASSDGADTEIFSYAGEDEIEVSGEGTYYIDSGSDWDIIYLEAQAATVFAGSGEDEVTAEGGLNIVDLGSGDDYFEAYDGVNSVALGAGSDLAVIYGGDNTIIFGENGGTGDENEVFVYAGQSSTRVVVSDHLAINDITAAMTSYSDTYTDQVLTLTVTQTGETLKVIGISGGFPSPTGGSFSFLDGPAISELVFADGLTVSGAQLWEIAEATPGSTISGTPDVDLLIGTQGNDTLNALAGADTVYGLGGNDVISGGSGADIIDAGKGNDVVFGGDGDDIFLVEGVSQGADAFIGGAGYDTVMGAGQPDTFFMNGNFGAANSIEAINGGTYSGYLADNVIDGTDANQTLDFSGTNLTGILAISGGGGNDVITGSASAIEFLIGGAGGDDVIYGGVGVDAYFWGFSAGQDTIYQNNAEAVTNDLLVSLYTNHESMWFSKEGDDLHIDIVGTDDSATFRDWYVNEQHQIGAITTGAYEIGSSADINALVDAMAMFDIPTGPGEIVPAHIVDDLAPTMANVWQAV